MKTPTLYPSQRRVDKKLLDYLAGLLGPKGYLAGVRGSTWGRYHNALVSSVEAFQAQHIDPLKREPLDVDGIVGPATWRALHDNSTQRLNIGAHEEGMIPDLEDPKRLILLCHALEHYDMRVREEPLGSNMVPAMEKRSQGKPWCSFWVHDRIRRTQGKFMWEGRRGSTRMDMRMAKKENILYSGDDRLLPGDVALVLNSSGVPRHTYIVVRVSEDGQRVNTVEGNISNRVGIRDRPRPEMWWDPFRQTKAHRDAIEYDPGIRPGLKKALGESTR